MVVLTLVNIDVWDWLKLIQYYGAFRIKLISRLRVEQDFMMISEKMSYTDCSVSFESPNPNQTVRGRERQRPRMGRDESFDENVHEWWLQKSGQGFPAEAWHLPSKRVVKTNHQHRIKIIIQWWGLEYAQIKDDIWIWPFSWLRIRNYSFLTSLLIICDHFIIDIQKEIEKYRLNINHCITYCQNKTLTKKIRTFRSSISVLFWK